MTTNEHPAFTIVGISARTNNAAEMSGKGAIGGVWARFMQEGILEKIPNRADSNIIALYTDYESDHTGDYTFVLGARVTTPSNMPAGMIAKVIPAGKYATFESEKGAMPGIVMNAWKRVWSASKEELGGIRSYLADYELYDHRSQDPKNAQIELVIGVK